MNIVYLQGRTHKAGAQSALERLMRAENMNPFKPVLVCDRPGWLTEQCTQHGIPWFAVGFPTSHSLRGRLYGNWQFAKRIAAVLTRKNIRPVLVCANDYIENLLSVELSLRLHIPQALLVRASGISKRDFEKYACGTTDTVIGIAEDMQTRLQHWTSRKVYLIHDALYENEILPPVSLPTTFPKKLLVIGSPEQGKGWADFTKALLISGLDDGTIQTVCFTGQSKRKDDLKLERFNNIKFEFLEWAHNFSDLVRKFTLVINPSRAESFGLAAIETIASGVPLLSTRTGIIEQVIDDNRFLCTPNNPQSLALTLRSLPGIWHAAPQLVKNGQEQVRTRFIMQDSAEKARELFKSLI